MSKLPNELRLRSDESEKHTKPHRSSDHCLLHPLRIRHLRIPEDKLHYCCNLLQLRASRAPGRAPTAGTAGACEV